MAVVGVGALVLGVFVMILWWLMSPDFFHGRPDSGDMPTVIAPDRSNLPPGETAVNPETGAEFTTGPRA